MVPTGVGAFARRGGTGDLCAEIAPMNSSPLPSTETASPGDLALRTRPCPRCSQCGADGVPLYQSLQDRLGDAIGTWSLARCPDPECGLVWQDPMPLEADIGKAY